ncbi:unnamed protein product [Penicillium glandicola]
MASSISSIIQACLKQFHHIVTSQELQKYQSEVLPDLWSDELGRLRVWTANIGAHQTGQSSLDYRLRDASHLKIQTLRVLSRLRRTIHDLQDVLLETSPQEAFSSDSDDSEDRDKTQIQRIFHSLRDTINVLFDTSMSIRKPAHHDKVLGVKRSDTAAFEPFDRQHVANKFPNLDVAIQDRLGLAISQRRATLRYRERHHLKLAQGLDKLMDTNKAEDTKSTIFSETVATEFVQKPTEDNFELQSTTSQTSYAKTIIEGGEGMVIPPPPKKILDGDPFECPYCFLLLNIDNRHSWARHVFHDLMPYICVFPECRTPHRLFTSRHEWYTHLQIEHEIPEDVGITTACALCHLPISSGKPLEGHLGRHLQELALFALPQTGSDEDDKSYTSKISEEDSLSEQPHSYEMSETADSVENANDFALFRLSRLNLAETPDDENSETVDYHLKESGRALIQEPDEVAAQAKDEQIERLERLIRDERTEREPEETARISEIEREVADKNGREQLSHNRNIAEAMAAKVAEAAFVAATEAAFVAAKEAAKYAPESAKNTPLDTKKTIKFKDAIGRKFTFPLHLCRTWKGMEDLIRQAFLHIEVIGPHVAEGHYDLVGPNGDIILPQVWETVVEPDMAIIMHLWPIPEKSNDPHGPSRSDLSPPAPPEEKNRGNTKHTP